MRYTLPALIIFLLTVNSFDVRASYERVNEGMAVGKTVDGEQFNCLARAAKFQGCTPSTEAGRGDTKGRKDMQCKGGQMQTASLEEIKDPKSNNPSTCEMTITSEDKKTGIKTQYKQILDKDGHCVEAQTSTDFTKGEEKNQGTTVQKTYCGKKDNIITVEDSRKKPDDKEAQTCDQIHMLNGKKNNFDCKKLAELVDDKKFQERKKDPAAVGGAPIIESRIDKNLKTRDLGGSGSAN